jgi:hypothetical protein
MNEVGGRTREDKRPISVSLRFWRQCGGRVRGRGCGDSSVDRVALRYVTPDLGVVNC